LLLIVVVADEFEDGDGFAGFLVVFCFSFMSEGTPRGRRSVRSGDFR
jgi:hypothetical protein